MKVLFLDVDGVMNTDRNTSMRAIGRGHIRLLQLIVSSTECSIVMSSSWRLHPWFLSHFARTISYRGMKLHSVTPELPGQIRGNEIHSWREDRRHKDRYAIIDDQADMRPDQLHSFFQTNAATGLTPLIAESIITHLNTED